MILEEFKKNKNTYRIAINNGCTVGEVENVINERLEEALSNHEDLEPFRVGKRVNSELPDYLRHCLALGQNVLQISRDIPDRSIKLLELDIRRLGKKKSLGRKRKDVNIHNIKKLHEEGLSYREIAKIVGNVSYVTIWRRLKE